MVRIVAGDAEPVLPAAVPVARALAVHAGLPVAIDGAVTLPAEFVGVLEVDELAVGQAELVAVIRIVAVEAPAPLLGVVEALRESNALANTSGKVTSIIWQGCLTW